MKPKSLLGTIWDFFKVALFEKIKGKSIASKTIYNLAVIVIVQSIIGILGAIVVPSAHYITAMVFDIVFISLVVKFNNKFLSYFYVLIYFWVFALNVLALINGKPSNLLYCVLMVWIGIRLLISVKVLKLRK
jgi:hypothetical protein